MEQYIKKSALVVEIERRTDELWALIPDGEKVFSNKHTKEETFNLGKYTALESLDKFIDTIEAKDVDLDKYYHDFLQKEWFDKKCNRTMSEMMAFTAKHFFELGMTVSKV